MYETEEQQIAAIKKWFNENGRQTLITAVAVIVLVFAYRVYTDNQQKHKEAASLQYVELLNAVHDDLLAQSALVSTEGGADAEAVENAGVKRATAEALAKEFIEAFSGTAQAPYASMILGSYAVQNSDLPQAVEYYQWALDATSSDVVRNLAALRIARLELELTEFEKVERRLQNLNTTGDFERFRLELLGDLAVKRSDPAQARVHYEAARAVTAANGEPLSERPLLDMKYYDVLVDDAVSLGNGEVADPVESEPSSEQQDQG